MEQIESLKSRYAHLLDVHQFLISLQDDLTEWKQEFLAKAALTGRVAFAPLLREAGELWQKCERLYGAGGGYRLNVADVLTQYFEENSATLATQAKVEASLAEIWIEVIIDPLTKAADYNPA